MAFNLAKFEIGETLPMLSWSYQHILLLTQWRREVLSKHPNAMLQSTRVELLLYPMTRYLTCCSSMNNFVSMAYQ
jgi:hypothetical protein